jgi:hypothetical protein
MSASSDQKAHKLTAEQQQTLAEVELARLRSRERLRRRTRMYCGRRWISFPFFIVAVSVGFAQVEVQYRIAVISILTIIFVLLQVHVTGINQRLDALVELQERTPGSDDEKNSNDKPES